MSTINAPVPMIVSCDNEAAQMNIGMKMTTGTTSVTDKEPYLFRASVANSADVAVDKIIGGTVAWNQLAAIPSSDKSKTQNGVTITDNRDGSFTVSTDANGATANTYLVTGSLPVIKDHKYFFKSAPIGGSVSTFYAYMTASGVVEGRTDLGNGCLQKCLSNGTASVVGVYVASGAIISTPIKFVPQIFDLTQMFGSPIADYVYTLESGTEGAGIAWLKKYGWFTKPYYPYAAANLLSVNTSAHKTVGFNQCGSTLTFGNIDSSGADSGTDARYVRTASYTRVVPNTIYCFYADSSEQVQQMYVLEYDANKSVLSRTAVYSGSVDANSRYVTFTTSGNTAFVRMFIFKPSAYSSADKVRFCLSLHWDGERDGEYEPYVECEYALDSTIELRGIPKLDASNNLYYDGDRYLPDGTVTRKFGIVDLGTLRWSNGSTNQSGVYRKTASLADAKFWSDASIKANIICSKYDTASALQTYRVEATGISINNSIAQVIVYDPNYNAGTNEDIASFKTAMDGVYLVYELATPTTESATPYIELQATFPDGTEEYVDDREVPIPVGHETQYVTRQTAETSVDAYPMTVTHGIEV